MLIPSSSEPESMVGHAAERFDAADKGVVGIARLAERWDELEGAREVVESMEETELEEGLRRRRDELAALRAEPGVRGVRGARRPSRLDDGSTEAMVVSILRCVTGIPPHA